MPIRKPHIGKGAVTRRHVEDALKFKTLDHVLLCRGAGANLTGNAGTTYTVLTASSVYVNPARYKGIIKVEAYVNWDPQTTAGGIRVWNATDSTALATSEPGAAGWRLDRIDVTGTFKAITAEKLFWVESKGDGTTAPIIAAAYIIVECGNV